MMEVIVQTMLPTMTLAVAIPGFLNGRQIVRHKELTCCKSEASLTVGGGPRWGKRKQNSKAKSTRINKSYERKEYRARRSDQYGPDRLIDCQAAEQCHIGDTIKEPFHEVRTSDEYAVTENRSPFNVASSAWVRIAGARRSPLSSEEEGLLSSDVQELLRLETQKTELEKKLGRPATVDEWANYSGVSVFKLYARIGKGRAAKRKMVAANLCLVNSIAERFRDKGLSHWDLCQEGVQGLLRSTEKYDTAYKTKFSTYSFMWIWERMSAGVKRFRNELRISRTVYKTASVVLQHKEEFLALHGRQPSLQELADMCRMDKEKIRDALRLVRPVKSMDSSVSTLEGDYENEIEDQTVGCLPWTQVMNNELRTEVAKALDSLTLREQRVLQMRYGLGGKPVQKRSEVAAALSLTSETIRVIEKKALDKLRDIATEDGLQEYLSRSRWAE